MNYPYTLPHLPYAYNAFEPTIDTQTMQIHHTKHHQAYIDKLNATLESQADLHSKTLEELLSSISSLPQDIQSVVQNHGGGHHNHSLFWDSLTPQGAPPTQEFVESISSTFESLEALQKKMIEQGMARFGSGWVWFVQTESKSLEILNTPNQDSPIMQGHVPLLGIDVWEHAYYLKYQSRRQEYLENIFAVVDWVKVESRVQA